MVENFCHKACWLKDGLIEKIGDTSDVIKSYEQYLNKENFKKDTGKIKVEKTGALNHRPAVINSVAVTSAKNGSIEFGKDLVLTANVTLNQKLPVYFAFSLDRRDGLCCYAASMKDDGKSPIYEPGHHKITVKFPSISLIQGSYKFVVFLMDKTGMGVLDQRETEFFKVNNSRHKWGVSVIPHIWEM